MAQQNYQLKNRWVNYLKRSDNIDETSLPARTPPHSPPEVFKTPVHLRHQPLKSSKLRYAEVCVYPKRLKLVLEGHTYPTGTKLQSKRKNGQRREKRKHKKEKQRKEHGQS